MRLLFRYLLRELAIPLGVAVGGLYLLLFAMQFLKTTDVFLGSAVRLRDIGLIAACLTPHFLVMCLPIAFLLAILLGLGRLNEDRELVAASALGVGPWQVVAAPLVIGCGLAALLLGLGFTAEPWGLSAVRGTLNNIIKRNLMGDVKSGVFYEDLPDLTLYVQSVDAEDQRWNHVLLHDDRDPAAPLLVLAREGRVNPGGEGESLRIVLADGEVHLAKRASTDYTVLSFEHGDVAIGVGGEIWRKNKIRFPTDELTPSELREAARRAPAQGEDPLTYWMAYQNRFARALTPVSFALMGAPLAMGRRQRGRAWGFFFALLGYVAYYIVAKTFENLGTSGRLPLLAAAELPNALFALLGVIALFRASRAGAIR